MLLFVTLWFDLMKINLLYKTITLKFQIEKLFFYMYLKSKSNLLVQFCSSSTHFTSQLRCVLFPISVYISSPYVPHFAALYLFLTPLLPGPGDLSPVPPPILYCRGSDRHAEALLLPVQ